MAFFNTPGRDVPKQKSTLTTIFDSEKYNGLILALIERFDMIEKRLDKLEKGE